MLKNIINYLQSQMALSKVVEHVSKRLMLNPFQGSFSLYLFTMGFTHG